MEKKPTGPKKTGAGRQGTRRQIDIPLDNVGRGRGSGAQAISDKELDFVNRHHEEYKELRRRARRQGGY